MSIREEATVPPCPLCGSTAHVERAQKVAQPWACSSCVLVYEGTTSEWEAMGRLRRAFEENQAE